LRRLTVKSTNTSTVVNFLPNTAGVANPPMFFKLTSNIKPVLSVTRRQTTCHTLSMKLQDFFPDGHPELMAEVTFQNSTPIMLLAMAAFDETFTSLTHVIGLNSYLGLQPIHKRIYQ
jgi:hypothetical protein